MTLDAAVKILEQVYLKSGYIPEMRLWGNGIWDVLLMGKSRLEVRAHDEKLERAIFKALKKLERLQEGAK